MQETDRYSDGCLLANAFGVSPVRSIGSFFEANDFAEKCLDKMC